MIKLKHEDVIEVVKDFAGPSVGIRVRKYRAA